MAKDFSLTVNVGSSVVTFVDLSLPTGTNVAKLFATTAAGATSELIGAAVVGAGGVTLTIPGSFTTSANLPATLDVQISNNSGAYVSYAAGRLVGVSASTGTEIANDVGAPITTSVQDATSGGLDRRRVIAAASTNATSVKASPGQVYTIHAFNSSAATKFIKLYNKASAPTVGTDTPVETYPIGAGQQLRVSFEDIGNSFTVGIALAITGAVADTDTTATAANDVVLNIHYA